MNGHVNPLFKILRWPWPLKQLYIKHLASLHFPACLLGHFLCCLLQYGDEVPGPEMENAWNALAQQWKMEQQSQDHLTIPDQPVWGQQWHASPALGK